jgi:hypothetical protein
VCLISTKYERLGVVETRTISRFHPAQTADLLALTADGQELLDEHRDPERDHWERYYGGWVEPAELWHDAALYHATSRLRLDAMAARSNASFWTTS